MAENEEVTFLFHWILVRPILRSESGVVLLLRQEYKEM